MACLLAEQVSWLRQGSTRESVVHTKKQPAVDWAEASERAVGIGERERLKTWWQADKLGRRHPVIQCRRWLREGARALVINCLHRQLKITTLGCSSSRGHLCRGCNREPCRWHSQAEGERRSPSHFGASFLATTNGRKHSAGTGGATAPRPGITRMAKNMMKRDTEKRHFERHKSSMHCGLKQCFFGRDQHQR